jgi:restriction system protein
MDSPNLPTYDQMMNPLVQVLKELGGSATIDELDTKVTERLRIPDNQLERLHDPERGSQTEIEYRLAWARTYLKKYGIVENSSRGVWALTTKGRSIDHVDTQALRRFVAEQARKKALPPTSLASVNEVDESDVSLQPNNWREELIAVLQHMHPAAFERLAQRILREAGFTQVEVTGRSGDGGIDGKGIMRLGGILSFHVIFQCKRYQGSVTANHIRDFRGAMVGRADKGLFITTGNYTKDAMREATRDGAPAIDLIDGDQLIDKLKELGLGIESKKIEIEQITIDKKWFDTL